MTNVDETDDVVRAFVGFTARENPDSAVVHCDSDVLHALLLVGVDHPTTASMDPSGDIMSTGLSLEGTLVFPVPPESAAGLLVPLVLPYKATERMTWPPTSAGHSVECTSLEPLAEPIRLDSSTN